MIRPRPRRVGTALVALLLAAAPTLAGQEEAPVTSAASDDVRDPSLASPRSKVAWTLLNRGRYSEALRNFTRLTNRYPGSGRQKIGYALASAGSGYLVQGARAMRRALRMDHAALRDLRGEPGLRPHLEKLASRYRRRLISEDDNQEMALMLGALSYLLGETESLGDARHLITASSNVDPSALNLKYLIDELERAPVGVAALNEAPPPHAPPAPIEVPLTRDPTEPSEAPAAVEAVAALDESPPPHAPPTPIDVPLTTHPTELHEAPATLTYEFSHPSNVGAATYYHATYARPAWAKSLQKVARVGRHIFYE